MTSDQDVDRRGREIRVPAERKEIDLRNGSSSPKRAGCDFRRNLPQARNALAASPRGRAHDPALTKRDDRSCRPGQTCAQSPPVRSTGKVQQHALDRDHGNRPLDSHFIGLQAPGLVQPHSSVRRSTRPSQHLHRTMRAAQTPEMAGTEVGEHGSRAAGEHSGDPSRLAGESAVSQGIEPLEERDRHPHVTTTSHDVLTDPQLKQLPVRERRRAGLRQALESPRSPRDSSPASPPSPNCIKFPAFQPGNLMQFGVCDRGVATRDDHAA